VYLQNIERDMQIADRYSEDFALQILQFQKMADRRQLQGGAGIS